MNTLYILISTVYLLFTIPTFAQNSLRSQINSGLYNLGSSINGIELPVLGSASKILPFAVVSFCLQKFPEQTLLFLGLSIAYLLRHNSYRRAVIGGKCYAFKRKMNRASTRSRAQNRESYSVDS